MEIHHLPVTRTARVAVLGGPHPAGPLEGDTGEVLTGEGDTGEALAGEEDGAAREFWTVLHGYRQLAPRFLRRFTSLASPRRRILAPEALSRFYLEARDRAHQEGDPIGASWMTRECREAEIEDYVAYLDAVALELGGPGRHTVVGFSQGAHTAARWAVLGATKLHRLILWGAAFPGDLPPQAPLRLGPLEIILVRGAVDGLRNREDELREERWLRNEGVAYRILEHPGGHEVTPEVLALLTQGVR